MYDTVKYKYRTLLIAKRGFRLLKVCNRFPKKIFYWEMSVDGSFFTIRCRAWNLISLKSTIHAYTNFFFYSRCPCVQIFSQN